MSDLYARRIAPVLFQPLEGQVEGSSLTNVETGGLFARCARHFASRFSSVAVGLVAIVALTGCMANWPAEPVQQGGSRPALAEKPDETQSVRGAGEPAMVTLPIGEELIDRRATEGDALPSDIRIENTHFNRVPVAAALQAVLADTDISLTWSDDEFDDRLVTILNLSGTLDKVVERICSAARIYCTYRNGTLELLETETFIIEMPPIPNEAENSIADAIGILAGNEVNVDKDGGNIIYTTDMQGQQRVRQYLSQLRRGRPLVVMQLYIWEVRLSETKEAGIRWDSNSLDTLGVGGTDITPISTGNAIGGISAAALKGAGSAGGLNFGATFSGAVDAAAVLSFLQTNGNVETISNPQMTFVSGTSSEFSIGGKQNYISGVGQLVSSTVTSGGTGAETGLGSNTVQTEEIETGLTVKVSGSYEGGVIFGEMSMEDITLLGFDRVPSSGTTIQLPRTQERKLSTIIRLRPGDTLLLAGLRSTSDTGDLGGAPTGLFGILPINSAKTTENREMVIMLRPSIIRFTDAPGKDRVEPIKAKSLNDLDAGDEVPAQQPDAPEKSSEHDNTQARAAHVSDEVIVFENTARASNATALTADGVVSAVSLQQTFRDISQSETIQAPASVTAP